MSVFTCPKPDSSKLLEIYKKRERCEVSSLQRRCGTSRYIQHLSEYKVPDALFFFLVYNTMLKLQRCEQQQSSTSALTNRKERNYEVNVNIKCEEKVEILKKYYFENTPKVHF